MRIFKNRGDIYFSKVNKEKSAEQRILIIALIVIVTFTVLFVGVIGFTNDFSAKKFFAPDEPLTNQLIQSDDYIEPELPEVSGKNNYALMIYDEKALLFTALIQSDMDSRAFKASVIKSDTELDGNSMSSIFASSGAQGVITAIDAGLGIDVDYYMAFEKKNFENFYDKLGTVNFPVFNEIKYKNNDSPSPYTLKIKAGEQKIDGKHFINLIRYYIDGENNFSQANELLLVSMSYQLNSKNMADGDYLFKTFVKMADTNITIRDYSLASDRLTVIANEQLSMSVYNAPAQYNGNQISDEGLKKIKGYFVK